MNLLRDPRTIPDVQLSQPTLCPYIGFKPQPPNQRRKTMTTKKKNKKAPQTEPTTTEATTTPAPEPTPTTEKKISGTEFVERQLIANPDATLEELRKALDEAGVKMSQTTLETWPPFMKKIFKLLDEGGWKRPKKKAEAAGTAPASTTGNEAA